MPTRRNKLENIRLGGIDMACFCFHHSVFNSFKFDGKCAGDFNFIDKIRKSKKFKFKFTDLKIGIGANYNGAKGGKN